MKSVSAAPAAKLASAFEIRSFAMDGKKPSHPGIVALLFGKPSPRC